MSERLRTARELAEMLGVMPKTVLRWTETRGLPGYRIGRRCATATPTRDLAA